ncbi:RsmB/NOP family class I SAM-dependent RNA methyltransferase [Sphingomonas sp. ASV193]|uniref:RsmB/NOP family class I SAM-dependent RNA methyltransferase n=1 Tax=Sphingomonas sp. ASV193 TaxID=3144405 RepID=UPI0032E89D14
MPAVPGLAPRRAALRMLDGVLRRGETLDRAAALTKGLAPHDAALALAIAGETLRRLPALDAAIDSATRQSLPDDSKARAVLRLALAQKAALDVPDHALVATALPLVDGGPRRLVHGVLGTLLRKGATFSDADPLPDAVEQRWRAAWGDEVVAAARRAILRRPPLDLSFRSDVVSDDFPLGQSLAPRHRRLGPDDGGVTSLPGYAEGDWWVQDLAASLPARLVPAHARSVIDACAAPGGKTMQLAAAGHAVTALDRSESRLERLRANLARTRLDATPVAADALDWSPPAPADAVLLDAPCSATGTFRRHPEVLHRATARIIADCAELQARLLDRAATWLRPGGSLVYAVCSLEPQEGEVQVDRFLGKHPGWRLEPAPPAVPGIAPRERGWLRLLPGQLEEAGGLDGFFIAHLVRGSD